MFDRDLRKRAANSGGRFVAFDAVADYDRYVDGKPREEGVRNLLASRGIDLPLGDPSDSAEAETIIGLGKRKDVIVLRMIRDQGVKADQGSVRYARAAREAGLGSAVVSSSSNCREVLSAAGIADLFEQRIDGVVADREHLKGKPPPTRFWQGRGAWRRAKSSSRLRRRTGRGSRPDNAGGFGFVVGVDRVGQADALLERGADIVVSDLADPLEDA